MIIGLLKIIARRKREFCIIYANVFQWNQNQEYQLLGMDKITLKFFYKPII
jgi:hypothetical protein